MFLDITGEIDQALTKKFLKSLIRAGRYSDKQPLIVYINSEGGSPRDAFAMYEALRAFKKTTSRTIITHAVHEVASSAVIPYLAGDERYASRYALFLIHNTYHEVGEEARAKYTEKDYEARKLELQKETKVIYDFIIQKTALSKRTINANVLKAPNGDWEFDVHQAMKFKIVDEVYFPFPHEYGKVIDLEDPHPYKDEDDDDDEDD